MSSLLRLSSLTVLVVLALAGCNTSAPAGGGDAGGCASVGGSWSATTGATGMMICGDVSSVTVTQTGCSVTLGLETSTGTVATESGNVDGGGSWSASATVPGVGDEPGSIGRMTANFAAGTLEYRSGSPEAVVCSWTIAN